jgi:hypothetical protein
MSKKIKAQYGVEEVQVMPPFDFTDNQVDTLLTTLSCQHGSSLTEQLQRTARNYLWLKRQYETKPSRAEQNAALSEVRNLARELARILPNLDKDTESELLDAAVLRVGSLAQLADQIEIVADGAEKALRKGQSMPGPRRKTAIDRTVADLADLFEKVTGSTFTHNPKEFTDYTGRPHSGAGKFVVEFFKIVDPTVKETSISTAMAGYVKARQIKNSKVN